MKEQELNHSSNPMGKEVFKFTTEPFTMSVLLWQGNILFHHRWGKMGKFMMFQILPKKHFSASLIIAGACQQGWVFIQAGWLQMLTLKGGRAGNARSLLALWELLGKEYFRTLLNFIFQNSRSIHPKNSGHIHHLIHKNI